MNKFKKIGLTALAASLVSVSANAEVAVTGTATLSFAGGGDHVTGNGWSMNDHLAFAWGGELDNGFTVDMAFRLDNGDNGTNSRLFDNRSMAIGMGDAGTLTFYGSAGDSVISAKDDVMPTAYEESFTGADGPGRGAASGINSFMYSNSMIDGVTLMASYEPSGGAIIEGSMEFGVEVTALEGLTLGIATGEDKGDGVGSEVDNTITYITYAFGPVTVGYQQNESDDKDAASTIDIGDQDYQAMAISYAVSEDLSVSIAESELDYEAAALADQKSTSFNASYTMGSMAWSFMHTSHDNASGVATNDYNDYIVAVAFSF
jgi:outer membrane protein OmpU